ncbi:hypothetical protein CCM_06211 [Cordyceps militaris CM01]|uniref:Uncharacterized protein n=1 Tax=Cordyceps militaris (strain CM01) TaxID=983644 RepID=G3JJG3_CORMM|nr:uncharacterized protein CCM_06211 [Cordyceps militaris CM01]EGX92051.1 hypothetical protein CCM_06211 [Cordyceps militaris CM01]
MCGPEYNGDKKITLTCQGRDPWMDHGRVPSSISIRSASCSEQIARWRVRGVWLQVSLAFLVQKSQGCVVRRAGAHGIWPSLSHNISGTLAICYTLLSWLSCSQRVISVVNRASPPGLIVL